MKSILKPEKRKTLLCVLLLLIYYLLPVGMYLFYSRTKVDLTDVGLGLYLVVVPLLIALCSAVYCAVYEKVLECVGLVVLCGVATAFMPAMGGAGLLYALAMGFLALISGAMGCVIGTAVTLLIQKLRRPTDDK